MGCKTVLHDFAISENIGKSCGEHDASKCLKVDAATSDLDVVAEV